MPLNPKNWNQLSAEERYVIENKGTEYPFTGVYDKFFEKGTYVCKRCESELYTSESKFNSGCGWPAFDSNIETNVERVLDADGRRVEIICRNCKGHLGHVFEGERFTETNTRHCVNSISIKFIPD
jgi:peptide-methionine (R)-S-oxide reductase